MQKVGRLAQQTLPGFALGAGTGAGAVWWWLAPTQSERCADRSRRALLPKRIILIRHGESEGNLDETVYQRKGDNLVELSDRGSQQAVEAGKRIKQLLGDEKVVIFLSPFQRTYQTCRNLRVSFEANVVRTEIEPMIREQEFGNLQNDDFHKLREQQREVGRFWYRFPTGESGADVYQRVQTFWDTITRLNTNHMLEPVDNVLVVTHGLTIRFLLMRLFRWSPDSFETVYNAGNCEIFVLTKQLESSQFLPYKLNEEEGSFPRSSRKVKLFLKGGREKLLDLTDYIRLPQPRTMQPGVAMDMLAEQYNIPRSDMAGLDFFVEKKFAKYR